jgi:hypothetical protein
VEAIGVAAAALLVVLFVSQRHRTEVAQQKKEAADAIASQPVQTPPVSVTPPETPELAMKVPAEDTIATGSANGRAETTFPASGAKEPVQQRKQAPKTGYSADHPFVPEWEQQAAGEQAAEGLGASNVPEDVGLENTAEDKNTAVENTANTAGDNTGGTNQALSNGVAVPAVYPYALRVSSAETVGDLARSVEAIGGKVVDASGTRIDPASFASGNQPALVRAIVKPGSVDAMTKLLAKYGATSKTKPPSAAEFASQTVEFDLSIAYAP